MAKNFIRFQILGLRMETLGDDLAESQRNRIRSGIRVDGNASSPLSPRYARSKARRFGNAKRNWNASGLTLSSLQRLRSGDNRVVIGFVTPEANKRAAINNAREKMFGLAKVDWDLIGRHFLSFVGIRYA